MHAIALTARLCMYVRFKGKKRTQEENETITFISVVNYDQKIRNIMIILCPIDMKR
jgi:hypothetical protein